MTDYIFAKHALAMLEIVTLFFDRRLRSKK